MAGKSEAENATELPRGTLTEIVLINRNINKTFLVIPVHTVQSATYRDSVLRKMGLITPNSMLGNPSLESTPTTGAGTPNTEDLKAEPTPKGRMVTCYDVVW